MGILSLAASDFLPTKSADTPVSGNITITPGNSAAIEFDVDAWLRAKGIPPWLPAPESDLVLELQIFEGPLPSTPAQEEETKLTQAFQAFHPNAMDFLRALSVQKMGPIIFNGSFSDSEDLLGLILDANATDLSMAWRASRVVPQTTEMFSEVEVSLIESDGKIRAVALISIPAALSRTQNEVYNRVLLIGSPNYVRAAIDRWNKRKGAPEKLRVLKRVSHLTGNWVVLGGESLRTVSAAIGKPEVVVLSTTPVPLNQFLREKTSIVDAVVQSNFRAAAEVIYGSESEAINWEGLAQSLMENFKLSHDSICTDTLMQGILASFGPEGFAGLQVLAQAVSIGRQGTSVQFHYDSYHMNRDLQDGLAKAVIEKESDCISLRLARTLQPASKELTPRIEGYIAGALLREEREALERELATLRDPPAALVPILASLTNKHGADLSFFSRLHSLVYLSSLDPRQLRVWVDRGLSESAAALDTLNTSSPNSTALQAMVEGVSMGALASGNLSHLVSSYADGATPVTLAEVIRFLACYDDATSEARWLDAIAILGWTGAEKRPSSERILKGLALCGAFPTETGLGRIYAYLGKFPAWSATKLLSYLQEQFSLDPDAADAYRQALTTLPPNETRERILRATVAPR